MSGASFGTLGVITQVARAAAPAARGDRHRAPDLRRSRPAGRRRRRARPPAARARRARRRATRAARARSSPASAAPPRSSAATALDGFETVEDDEELWRAQRAGQRSADGTVVRVSALPSELPDVLRVADETRRDASSGRAGVGTVLPVAPGRRPEEVELLRAELAPAPASCSTHPPSCARAIDPWGVRDGPELALTRRVKARFDPERRLQPRHLHRRHLANMATTGAWDDTRPPSPSSSTTACTAASACRRARPTCCGARRWTRRAGGSSSCATATTRAPSSRTTWSTTSTTAWAAWRA